MTNPFASLTVAPPDPILGLSEAFRSDPNPAKVNLTVGVFKDANGTTPILECVKQAEESLLRSEISKSYLGIDGLADYTKEARHLLLGDGLDDRAVTLQTPGGTGALRVGGDFLTQHLGRQRIWCSQPTWANHPKVFEAAGLSVETYRYLDRERHALDFEAMLADLGKIPTGDVVCFHGCCHNPTGVDPSAEQWGQIVEKCRERSLLPLVDCAYQGFGDGLEPDSVGVRTFAKANCEFLVSTSFSKNFSLYNERVGALTLVAANADAATAVMSRAKMSVRANYSNPPKHGAAIVAGVLQSAELRALWEDELQQMRDRIRQMRESFVSEMNARGVDRDFSFINHQKGMFSFSGLTPMQVDELRENYSIYIVGSGRINVAGMTPDNMKYLCDSIAAVL